MPRDVDVAIARAFLSVVETGSVTHAARQLNLTQGAISQQLRRLEDLSETPLFTRIGRNLALTSEGRRLVPATQHFLAANDQLLAVLRRPVFEGEVRFGAPYDIIGSYAPSILRRFSQSFPNVRVTLVCKDTLVLLEGLKSGEIDIALTTEAKVGKQGETLRSDRLVWAGAKNGCAYQRNPLPLSLGAETCVFRPIALAALKKARRDSIPICEVSNMEPVRATLEADLAVAPLLRHSIPDSLDIVASEANLPKLPMFQINLYQAESRSPATEAFADCVQRGVAAG
ncbi:MAG: DNA-binding transcriptional LysR family regulator [Hyphomicrobiaceae bacterium]|jgi:DNA-binding transcriptional LysR family regulator